MSIKKIIEINKEYNCHFDGNKIRGFPHSPFNAYGRIRITKRGQKYITEVFSVNDKGLVCSYLGVYKYVYSNGKIRVYEEYIHQEDKFLYELSQDDDIYSYGIAHPIGWDIQSQEKLKSILEELRS